jgi:CubicO group peptidase (beta-lactamase class C family)
MKGNTMRYRFLVLMFLAGSPLALAAKAGDYAGGTVVTGDLGHRLDAFMQSLAAGGFSGALLVAKDNEVVLAKGFGLADRENKRPVTTETVFPVGSLTKQFTAAAILKLEMQGKLKITDPIGKYFTNVPEDKAPITLHHLLTHSAGLESDFGDDFEKVDRGEIIRRAMASKLRSKPGQHYHYANAGYSLLGAVVEIVSGKPYEAYLHENLFQPVGLTKTGYRLPGWRPDELAIGYERGKRFGTIVERPWAADGPYWNLRANGGIHSTLADMYRWHRALEADAVLSAEARKKMFTPHVREGGFGQSYYGYGWSVTKTRRGTTLIDHNGSNGIFYAEFRRYVDEGVVFYLETNLSELANGRVAARVDRVIFGSGVPAVPRAAPQRP